MTVKSLGGGSVPSHFCCSASESTQNSWNLVALSTSPCSISLAASLPSCTCSRSSSAVNANSNIPFSFGGRGTAYLHFFLSSAGTSSSSADSSVK